VIARHDHTVTFVVAMGPEADVGGRLDLEGVDGAFSALERSPFTGDFDLVSVDVQPIPVRFSVDLGLQAGTVFHADDVSNRVSDPGFRFVILFCVVRIEKAFLALTGKERVQERDGWRFRKQFWK